MHIGQIGVQESRPSFCRPSCQTRNFFPVFLVPIHAVYGDERPLEGAQGIVPCHPVENLRQVGAGVDVGMERIAHRPPLVYVPLEAIGIVPVAASNRSNVFS